MTIFASVMKWAGAISLLMVAIMWFGWLERPFDGGLPITRIQPAERDLLARGLDVPAPKRPLCDRRHLIVAVTTFIRQPKVTFALRTFKGDGRLFDHFATSYRTRQIVVVQPDPAVATDPFVRAEESVGQTVAYDYNDKVSRTGYASTVGRVLSSGADRRSRWIDIILESSDPLVKFAPAIDNRIRIWFGKDGRTLTFEVEHDGYPENELDVFDWSGKPLAHCECDTKTHGNTPETLFPFLGDHRDTCQPLRLF